MLHSCMTLDVSLFQLTKVYFHFGHITIHTIFMKSGLLFLVIWAEQGRG